MKTSAKPLPLTALFLCFHSAVGLQCWSCSGVSCSSQTQVKCLASDTFCSSQLGTVSRSDGVDTWMRKGCADPSVCSTSGTYIISYDTDYKSLVENITCCDSDNCNAADPLLLPPAGSDLRCYRCDPYLRNCSTNATCSVLETCSNTSFPDAAYSVYGCVSKNLCNNPDLSDLYFDTHEKLSCCNSTHCNTPPNATEATPTPAETTPTAAKATPTNATPTSAETTPTTAETMPTAETEATPTTAEATPTAAEATPTTAKATPTPVSVSRSDGVDTWMRKGCADPSVCSTSGTYIISYDTDYKSLVENITCCDSDNCNAADPLLLPPAGSDLRCYRCDPYLRNCSTNATCSVLETCSNTSFPDAAYSVYGCVSKNLCNNPDLSDLYFDTHEKLSCCNSTHCNTPPNATEATPTPAETTPTAAKATPTNATPTSAETTPTTAETMPTAETEATPTTAEATPTAAEATPTTAKATPTPVSGKDSGLDSNVDEGSVFSGARRLLSVALLLSLLQFCFYTLF